MKKPVNKQVWALCILAFGLLSVGVIYGCVWAVIPDRPIARDWSYSLLLFAPYLLTALGIAGGRWDLANVKRLFFSLASCVVLLGIVNAGAVTWEAGAAISAAKPPVMPASAILVGFLLVLQFWLGGAVLLAGLVTRSGYEKPPG